VAKIREGERDSVRGWEKITEMAMKVRLSQVRFYSRIVSQN
jgi:hypothetical protein